MNEGYIYIITTKEGREYAFNDFNLVEQFVDTLQNGTFYFRKIKVVENQQELDTIINNDQQTQPQ